MKHDAILKWILKHRGFIAASKKGVAIRIAVEDKIFMVDEATLEDAMRQLFIDLEKIYKGIEQIFQDDYSNIIS